MINGEKVIDDILETAEKFNDQFLEFANINTNDAHLPNIVFKTNSGLESVDITVSETMDILQNLDTSKDSGPDGISCKMMKETTAVIALSITKLINLSLYTCTFPSLWKQLNVLPIYKNGDRSDFKNYRPVSLLNVCSKVCEKVIFKRVFNC